MKANFCCNFAFTAIKTVPLISEFLNGWFAPSYIKNCLIVRKQSTSSTDEMTSLECLSKDDIPSVLEVDWMYENTQFLYKTSHQTSSINLKIQERRPLRDRLKYLLSDLFVNDNKNLKYKGYVKSATHIWFPRMPIEQIF